MPIHICKLFSGSQSGCRHTIFGVVYEKLAQLELNPSVEEESAGEKMHRGIFTYETLRIEIALCYCIKFSYVRKAMDH